jgi:hypothetical protein
LKKWHVGDSHFLVVNDGNVRGVHMLILLSCCRGRMPLVVNNASYVISAHFIMFLCSFLSILRTYFGKCVDTISVE